MDTTEVAAFAPGTVLLHIGPHKTGTTTVQAAFHQNRAAAAGQGVLYPGRTGHPMIGAMAAATGKALATNTLEGGRAQWQGILDEVHAAPGSRAVVSSEFLSEAPADRIAGIVDGLGRDRVQVVITLRPLVRILASQWQQYMQNRPALNYSDELDYDGWLHQMLDEPGASAFTPSFWQRHAHDRLVETWVREVGADRVTVVTVDERDRRGLLDAFEALTGLEAGTLEPRQLTANRSLTLPEVEMLRAFNTGYLAHGWELADYTRLMRFGALRHLQERTPAPGEPKLLTPNWAVERSAELGRDAAARIADLGVRVVGDLGLLGDVGVAKGVGTNPVRVTVPHEVTARTVAGLVAEFDRLPVDGGPVTGALGDRVRAWKRAHPHPARVADLRRREAELTDELSRTIHASTASRRQVLRVLLGRLKRGLLG